MSQTDIKLIEGATMLSAPAKIGIVASRFNAAIVDALLSACMDTLLKQGVSRENLIVVRVPGAVEISVVARKLAMSQQYDAIIALGAVIRGETSHYDFVAGECTRGLGRVGADFGVPVLFGVLTTDTVQQAAARAGGAHGNKGADVALAAIETINVLRQL